MNTATDMASDSGRRAAREFELSESDFNLVKRLIAEHAGIALNESKRNLVYGRLLRRLKALEINSFSDYVELIQRPGNQEIEHFVNSLTTNLTSFFREAHHFDYLHEQLAPELVREKAGKPIRAWSAGCSTGEEAYSMAMVLAESLPEGQPFRILATDLDSSVVERAQAGVYPAERVEALSRARLRRWFRRGTGSRAGLVRVHADLRKSIVFRQLNLLSSWPMRGTFDLIFCRNVIIYFTKDTQKTLFDRFHASLVAGGHVFIGHSESLYKVTDSFQPLGHTVYKRIP